MKTTHHIMCKTAHIITSSLFIDMHRSYHAIKSLALILPSFLSFRALPEVNAAPKVEPPKWSKPSKPVERGTCEALTSTMTMVM